MIEAWRLFEQAQLSEASYVFLENSIGDQTDLETSLRSDFSAIQAAEFVKHWRVANHQRNTESGFSATLFESLDRPGEYTFAVRGTESLTRDPRDLLYTDGGDIVADGVALDQIVDLYNYWHKLTAAENASYQIASLTALGTETILLKAAYAISPVARLAYEAVLRQRSDVVIDNPTHTVRTVTFTTSSQADGVGLSAASINVTGHSLGGHLAAAFTRLFPEANPTAYTINGAGFQVTNSNVGRLFDMLAGHPTSFDPSRILNVYGDKAPNL